MKISKFRITAFATGQKDTTRRALCPRNSRRSWDSGTAGYLLQSLLPFLGQLARLWRLLCLSIT